MQSYQGDIDEWMQHLWMKGQRLLHNSDEEDTELAWYALRTFNFMKYCLVEKQVYCYERAFLIRFHEHNNGYGYFIYLEDCEANDVTRKRVFNEVLNFIVNQKDRFSAIHYFPVKYKRWYEQLAPQVFHGLSFSTPLEMYGGWRLEPFEEELSLCNASNSGDVFYHKLKEENAAEVNAAWDYGIKDHIMPWIPLHLKYLPNMAAWSRVRMNGGNGYENKLVGQVFITNVGVLGGLFVHKAFRNHGIAVKLMKSVVNMCLKSNIIPMADVVKQNVASSSLLMKKLHFQMPTSTFFSIVFHDPTFTMNDVYANPRYK